MYNRNTGKKMVYGNYSMRYCEKCDIRYASIPGGKPHMCKQKDILKKNENKSK